MCFRYIIPVSAIFLALSCSILENRAQCPCFVHLDLSDPANSASDSIAVYISSDRIMDRVVVGRDSYQEGITVPVADRNCVSINAVDIALCPYFDASSLIIPRGEQCPSAYMHSLSCDTSVEWCEEKLRLKKNYCGVSLIFKASDLQDYIMTVDGNVCGYGRDGQPLDGSFLFRPEGESPSICFFRLPRQKDDSLRLCISTRDGKSRYLALGTYISQSGYDWSSEDLDDIVVSIDYASTTITVTINDWNGEQLIAVTV